MFIIDFRKKFRPGRVIEQVLNRDHRVCTKIPWLNWPVRLFTTCLGYENQSLKTEESKYLYGIFPCWNVASLNVATGFASNN